MVSREELMERAFDQLELAWKSGSQVGALRGIGWALLALGLEPGSAPPSYLERNPSPE